MIRYYKDYRSEVREHPTRLYEFVLVIIPLKRWVVVEPYGRTYHRSEAVAAKAADAAEAFHKKFPFTPPRSAKELARAARYCGLRN